MNAKKPPYEGPLQNEVQKVIDTYLEQRPEFRAAYEAEADRVRNMKPGETIDAPYFAELLGYVLAYMHE